VESLHIEITHDILSQGIYSDLKDDEVEIYLLNNSFKKLQCMSKIKRTTYVSMKFFSLQEAWTWLPINP
jgi:hypothetical protein